MDVSVRRIDDAFQFEGSSDRVGTIVMDNSADGGGKGEAVSPLQAMLMSMGGCSGIDVVSILKKARQEITSMEIDLHGDRVEKGFIKPFEHIHAHFRMDGDLDPRKVERAIRLSLEKYCTVTYMLHHAARMSASMSINGGEKVDITIEF